MKKAQPSFGFGRLIAPLKFTSDKPGNLLPLIEASWKPIAAIAVPVAVAIAPNYGSFFTNDRKVDGIILQEALSILKKDPQTEQEKSVRDWAIAVIEKLSGERFSSEAKEVLRETPGPISQTAVNPDPMTPAEIEEMRQAAARVNTTKLVDLVIKEIGQTEGTSAAPNQRIALYNASASLSFGPTTPWNSQFINWIVTQAGYTGTNDGRSRSWEGWGKDSLEEVGELVPGCILVAWRQRPNGWTGVSGFYTGREEDGRYRIVGGNIYNAVDATWIEADHMVTCRLPPDWIGPAQ